MFNNRMPDPSTIAMTRRLLENVLEDLNPYVDNKTATMQKAMLVSVEAVVFSRKPGK